MKIVRLVYLFLPEEMGINNIIVIEPGFQLLTVVSRWKLIVLLPYEIVLIDSITLLFDLEIIPDKDLRETAPL